MFDKGCADSLVKFFARKRVASFGDGPGTYKRYIDKTKKVALYDAYDGAPYSEENSEGRVKFLDLTAPQYGLPDYEWIVSLEVAEHIPAVYERIYLDNIFRHASEGVVISWAVPGQGGLSHVNNQPLQHVKEVFEVAGFQWNENESHIIQNGSRLPWLRRNINVFRRRSRETFDIYKI
jgi:hypothetical protein